MRWFERRENWNPQTEDARKEGDVDYGRVIHSASFRRLQGKTQILNLGDSDFYRTRLTHSLEVAQIAAGITEQLRKSFKNHPATEHLPDRSLIQTIGCAHDLGHPPFGHGGEVALNYCMYNKENPTTSGFEGNGQTLRILSRLESFSEHAGANLTRRTLLGILKYPTPYSLTYNDKKIPKISDAIHEDIALRKFIDTEASKPPKCYMDAEQDVVDWILTPLSEADKIKFQETKIVEGKHKKSVHKSFDCTIMDAADDIAYGVHDLEDAIALKLISEEQFRNAITEEKCSSFLVALKEKYPSESNNNVHERMVHSLFGDSNERKHYISRLVHHFITAIKYEEFKDFNDPILRYRAKVTEPQRTFLDALKNIVFEHVIKSPEVQHLEFKGQSMVVSVFQALQSDPNRLLPHSTKEKYTKANNDKRVICDFVAGMTDSYLLKTYERLFAPRMGSVFDRL